MSKINYCYHSHTYRCGHAFGEDEDYILSAINYGLKDYGVSDHVMLPGIVQESVRGDFSLRDGYLASIQSLKKKYRKKINVYVGFECEYSPQFLDYYRMLLKTKKVDYLILGQHCFFQNGQLMWYFDYDWQESVLKYTDHLIKGMATGLFLYAAHPDIFMRVYRRWDEVAKNCAKRIIDAAVKYDVPLEINLCHARYYGIGSIIDTNRYEYPYIPFWKMVAKSKAKVVIGFDAHRPIDVLYPGEEIVDYVVSMTGVKPIYNLSIKDKKHKI